MRSRWAALAAVLVLLAPLLLPGRADGQARAPGTAAALRPAQLDLPRLWRRLLRVLRGRPSRAQPVPDVRLPDDALVAHRVVGNLQGPVALAFLAPQTFLLLERTTGRVLLVRDGRVRDVVLDLAVNYAGERGLLAIALHPRFAETRLVYLYWTWRGRGRGAHGLEGDDGANPDDVHPLGNRLDRFRWEEGRLRFDRSLLTLPARTVRGIRRTVMAVHNGGGLGFGPDGTLYLVVGEQIARGRMQNLPAGPPPDARRLTGVVLRIHDDGRAPRDNPFVREGARLGGAVGSNLERIFAYGIRNSFGLDFDPESGALWMGENGDDAFDELNRVEPGFNSGWIQVMGPLARLQEYRAMEARSPDGLDNLPAFTPAELARTPQQALRRLYRLPGSRYADPLFAWKHPMAPTAVTFVRGDGLGAAYRHRLVVADVHGHLFLFTLTPDRRRLLFRDRRLADGVADNRRKGDLRESESLLLGTDFGVVTDLEVSPAGELAVVSLSRGAVFTVRRRPGMP